jgi:hypothetical protein
MGLRFHIHLQASILTTSLLFDVIATFSSWHDIFFIPGFSSFLNTNILDTPPSVAKPEPSQLTKESTYQYTDI